MNHVIVSTIAAIKYKIKNSFPCIWSAANVKTHLSPTDKSNLMLQLCKFNNDWLTGMMDPHTALPLVVVGSRPTFMNSSVSCSQLWLKACSNLKSKTAATWITTCCNRDMQKAIFLLRLNLEADGRLRRTSFISHQRSVEFAQAQNSEGGGHIKVWVHPASHPQAGAALLPGVLSCNTSWDALASLGPQESCLVVTSWWPCPSIYNNALPKG